MCIKLLGGDAFYLETAPCALGSPVTMQAGKEVLITPFYSPALLSGACLNSRTLVFQLHHSPGECCWARALVPLSPFLLLKNKYYDIELSFVQELEKLKKEAM